MSSASSNARRRFDAWLHSKQEALKHHFRTENHILGRFVEIFFMFNKNSLQIYSQDSRYSISLQPKDLKDFIQPLLSRESTRSILGFVQNLLNRISLADKSAVKLLRDLKICYFPLITFNPNFSLTGRRLATSWRCTTTQVVALDMGPGKQIDATLPTPCNFTATCRVTVHRGTCTLQVCQKSTVSL